LGANGQTPRFKPTAKKAPGSVIHNFRYETTDGRKTMKAAPAGNLNLHKSIDFNLSFTDPVVIRKGNLPVFID